MRSPSDTSTRVAKVGFSLLAFVLPRMVVTFLLAGLRLRISLPRPSGVSAHLPG